MTTQGEVLIAIINNLQDFAILREKYWYRIPVSSVNKWLKDRWPPQWLAFYQTRVFGEEAFAVNYFAQVVQIKKAFRWELFPNEPQNEKSNQQYYQVFLGEFKKLPEPILSRRWRRIVFIPTTWVKFVNAREINDLYDDSPLENKLWTAFKSHEIPAERQEFITLKEGSFALDFAIYCDNGSIDVETDGDTWHANPEKAGEDRLRDNALGVFGWKVLRFGTQDIQERIEHYCVPTVAEAINKLGGIDEGRYLPRKIYLDSEGKYQIGLFDDL
jgi:very-short-patch-repair endonuclease